MLADVRPLAWIRCSAETFGAKATCRMRVGRLGQIQRLWVNYFREITSNVLLKKLFWLLSRSGLFIYSRFPVFGSLKASLGIICRGDSVLVINRNDGRGVSFPGGLQYPWESAERALQREVREETGLDVVRSVVKLRYHSSADVPVNHTVFEIDAQGRLRGSWEGTPCWLRIAELEGCLLASQRRILELLESIQR